MLLHWAYIPYCIILYATDISKLWFAQLIYTTGLDFLSMWCIAVLHTDRLGGSSPQKGNLHIPKMGKNVTFIIPV